MRPSSSSDCNAPYRARQPVLIDFFAKEAAEQQQRANADPQQTPFAELTPRVMCQRTLAGATACPRPSTTRNVTATAIRQYLMTKGYQAESFLRDDTIQSRLNSVQLSPKSLLDALEIAYDAHHPLLDRLGVDDPKRSWLIYKLAGIATNKSGFRTTIMTALQNANNNPDQLIAAVLQHCAI